MKNLSFILILLFVSIGTKAQEVKKILTSGKWHVAYTQYNGSEPEKSESKNDEWIIFLPDGQTQEEHFGDKVSSKWSYSNSKKIIKMKGTEEKIQKIIEISEDKIIVEVIESGQENMIITYEK